jgi:hypothetical protein
MTSEIKELERTFFVLLRDLDEKITDARIRLDKLESKLKEKENEEGKKVGMQIMQ